MREFAKSSPKFWIDECWRKIKKLSLQARVIAPYLLSNPHSNMIGIYYLPIPFIAHETGLSHEETREGLQGLCEADFCSYDEAVEYVWVHSMAFDQLGTQLKPNDNRVVAIHKAYAALPSLTFLSDFYDKYASAFFLENTSDSYSMLEAPLESLASKEKEKEKNKEKEILMSDDSNVVPFTEHDLIFNVKNTSSLQKQKSTSLKSQALEVLQFLNEKTGRAYRPADSILKLIIARLKTGVSVMDCRQVIAKKYRDWEGDLKMSTYIRPKTLFNASNFEQYLGEIVLPKDEATDEFAKQLS